MILDFMKSSINLAAAVENHIGFPNTSTDQNFHSHVAASKLQAAWRGRQFRGPLNEKGFYEIYVDPADRQKYKLPDAFFKPGTAQKPLQFLQMPAHEIEDGAEGSFWTVTHTSAPNQPRQFVGLTLTHEDEEWEPEIPAKVLDKIADLQYVVVRHRVRYDLAISPRMPQGDAIDYANLQLISLPNFIGVLNDLKTIHQRGLIHRDIKLDNLLMKDGIPYLGDLDSMDFKNNLQNNPIYTKPYNDHATRQAYAGNADDWRHHQTTYGKVNDDLAMLLTIMMTCHQQGKTISTHFEKAQDHFTAAKDLKNKFYDYSEIEDHINFHIQEYNNHIEYLINLSTNIVKKEYLEHIKLLLFSKTDYHAKYGNELHLVDMLDLAR